MTRILAATVAYNTPWVVQEQLRLLDEYLLDDHRVFVVDNSTDASHASMRIICEKAGADYMPVPGALHEHPDGLNYIATLFRQLDTPHGWMGETGEVTHLLFLDHDVFPTAPVALGPLIDQAGFLGIGQRHAPTGVIYPWPGFLGVSRGWLNGRAMNFGGIRGEEKRDDGDAGSLLWPIFDGADWAAMPPITHGYRQVREPDDVGLQSYAYEFFCFGESAEWRHLTNTSRWLAVPDPEGRELLDREMVAGL